MRGERAIRLRLLAGGLGLFALAGCGALIESASEAVDPEPDPPITAPAEDDAPEVDGVQVPAMPSGERLESLRVVDGDSIEATLDGVKTEIRLEGYNAPELYDDSNEKTCTGLAAREALRLFVAEGEPSLLVGEDDRYGRTLGDLVVDGRSAADVLVAEGRGLATGDDDLRRLLMQEAAERRFGIWGEGCGQPLTEDLRIGDVQANPDGNDRYNLGDEWVQIENQGSGPIDLAGWVIRDDTTGHRFVLTGSLQPGSVLTVRSGSGTSTETDLYLGERFPVWSNDQETVILVDPSGVHVHWRFLS